MRILVVSETGTVGSVFIKCLGRAGILVDCTSGADIHTYPQACNYDALLLALPSPAPILNALRRTGERRPVLVMAAGDAMARAGLFDLGADDVVPTFCQPEELTARLRAVVRRACGYASSDLVAGAARLRLGRMEIGLHGTVVSLTPKEYSIMEMLFLRPRQVHAKSTIMNYVYGAEEDPAVRTLDVIVCKLRKKLAANGAPDLVATIWCSGLTLRELPGQAISGAVMPELAAA